MNYVDHIRHKIIAEQALSRQLTYWRFRDYNIVFTNGCFDILHYGHIDYLAKARELGDILMIGLNTDESVRRIKGPARPVNDEQARAHVLASLSFVDAVVFFNEDTPYNLIRLVKPDVLVKGSDYQPDDIVGADVVRSTGGKVITLQLVPGYSTSSIIEKLRKNNTKDHRG